MHRTACKATVMLFLIMILMAVRQAPAQSDPGNTGGQADLQSLNELNKAERDVRDPFWPVGYYPEWWLQRNQPQEQAGVKKADKWEEARRKIEIKGMSRMGSSGYFAVINGKTMGRGDVVSIEHEGKTYRWVLSDIGRDGIRLNRMEDE